MDSDAELLRMFARTRSEDAFAELVRRHIHLVHSTAQRTAGGDAHLAEDATQGVFTDLARKAGLLANRRSLAGWLYTSAHFAAAKLVRTERRRRQREEDFMREPANEPASEADWDSVQPVLEEVMHELKPADREAILLRHFENRPLVEVGAKLGLTENTARMRVERALDKLRARLARRGVSCSPGLAAALSAHAVQTAPPHLAAALAATSLSAAQTGTTLTLLKIMTATQVKLGLGALLATGAATVVVLQHQSEQHLRASNQSLQEQVAQLRSENEKLSDRPAPTAGAPSEPDPRLGELLRLRSEVGLLRQRTNELGRLVASSRAGSARQTQAAADPASTPPEEYPKTPDGATRGIFESWARGDWNSFFTNYGEPGVPRELYDQMFSDPVKSNYLMGMEIVSLGTPTNSFGPNMWFVPYKLRFKDGSEKEFRLHVAQDPRTQRWFFKGGF